ncbi:MAG: ribosome biogenesis/translation initiation ATPase RLI [Candidatus Methanomethylicota archaeon]|uniref:Ribosome biogenesis/translation initiation ATPase RLI n=1 Tax=Thermoproteota archaeon TaxID=2056631 RepID=A0A497ERF6_9CREN|nr:MAG: ribosome biogenesis/translation initiation ATPase RLI [Candidatus Verstraetearchaeota archaeon]
MARVAVVDREFCKPNECLKECVRFCPLVRSGKEAIKFDEEANRPLISEDICTGCGICVKKCPFKALTIVNLPDELEERCVHRYGANMFKLYGLPIPKKGLVVGLIGPNGVGKSTALRILAGEIKPNLGDYEDPPSWSEIIRFFRGSELQPYFQRFSEGKVKVAFKPQYVDKIPQVVKGKVGDLLNKIDEKGKLNEVVEALDLKAILDRDIRVLSGGELQRVAIAAVTIRKADVYIFDEPSSYLDVKQRIKVAQLIRSLVREDKYVLVAEHDLAVLDYLSDQVCIFYGKPGVYGIVSNPHGVRVGINLYLDGYLPDENLRFREKPVYFRLAPHSSVSIKEKRAASWSDMRVKLGSFELEVASGEVHRGEIVGILGPNGIGKTTFVKLLAGLLEPDEGYTLTPGLKISYKPQYIAPLTSQTVREVLTKINQHALTEQWILAEVIKPLGLEPLLDRPVDTLSGGELQRVAIASCLLREADLYLLDEPSAHLDIEQRLAVAHVLNRIVEEKEVAAFVVEHDLIMLDLLADTLVVFSGSPGVTGRASSPLGLREGMNKFLKEVGITFRRDPNTGRPRVNKEGSWLDRYQKELGEYFYISAEIEAK